MPAEPSLRDSITRSPHSVDPLSWFTSPFLPVTFAAAVALGGVGVVFATIPDFESPLLQLVAVFCFVLSCLAIHRRAVPRLLPFRSWHALPPLVIAWLGVVLSGVGAGPVQGDLSRWWAPLGMAVVLAALAPFSSALLMVAIGSLSTVVCSVVAVAVFGSHTPWPVVTTIVMAALVPLQATVATALFSAFVVDRVLRWSALPMRGALAPNPALDFSQWNAEDGELKLLSDRVMPFIEQVARDGFVNLRDRTVAADLAREVRDALLRTVNRSWLDSLASGHRLRVIDPSNLADRLTLAQRGAVRSLIVAVIDSPALVADTLVIELRDSADGGVAVGLSMRLDLPEGKRLMMLAPYYLTLRATVDDLVWEDQDQSRMRFRIPAPERNRD